MRVCLGDQTDAESVDLICHVVGGERDRRTRKATNNHRTDNEGDDEGDDDDNNGDNKAPRSSPIPNRFLDGDGDVGVTSMTTVI